MKINNQTLSKGRFTIKQGMHISTTIIAQVQKIYVSQKSKV